MLIAIIIFSIFVIFLIKYTKSLINFRNFYKFTKTIPGPSFWELKQVEAQDLYNWFLDLHSRFGSTFGVWYGLDFIIYVTDPEDVRKILSSNTLLTKSNSYNLLRPWLGNGLLVNNGLEWAAQRKLLTPSFHFNILSSFQKPIKKKCEVLIEILNKVADGKRIVDISQYITLFALDVISETAMGINQNYQMNSDSEFVSATKKISTIIYRQAYSIWKRIAVLNNLLTNDKAEQQKLLTILHGETKRVIESKRQLVNEQQQAELLPEKKRFAFLDMLLLLQKNGMKISDQNIQEEVDTFMFAGHDTVGTALGFAIYLLSEHEKVQKKAYEEAIELLENERDPMEYIEAIIKETLRLYPPVPGFNRMITESLSMNNYQLPIGSIVSIPCFALHRNPKIFNQPHLFKPERFLNEHHFPPFSFVPFSAGPRNCIGQRFAMLELKCALSKLLRAFEFLPISNYEPIIHLETVLKSKNGIQVRMRRR